LLEPRAAAFLPLIGLAVALIYLESVVQNTKHCNSIASAKAYCLTEQMQLSSKASADFKALGPEAKQSEIKKFEDLFARLESVRESKINQYVQCGYKDGDMSELRVCTADFARELRKVLGIDVKASKGDAAAPWPGQNLR
jgi:hypothetical protein